MEGVIADLVAGGDEARREGRALAHAEAGEEKRGLGRAEGGEDLVRGVGGRAVVKGERHDLPVGLHARHDRAEELVRGRLAVAVRAVERRQRNGQDEGDALHANSGATRVMKSDIFFMTRFESWLLKSNHSMS